MNLKSSFVLIEAQVLNFFGKRFCNEFVVVSYFMRISETRGETKLQEIISKLTLRYVFKFILLFKH